MIIKLKSAPELGWLKVVSDDHSKLEGCQRCALVDRDDIDCGPIECGLRLFHFEQVKPNE